MIRTRSAALLTVLMLSTSGPGARARDVPGFGRVDFPTSCAPAVQGRFEAALARLHAFDGPEDAFRAIAAADPRCAIAWWGAAMAVRGNPLAGAPDRNALDIGRGTIAKALAAGPATPREAGLIAAMQVYYRDPGEDHTLRTQAYEAAMRRLAEAHPGDAEVQSLFALAILEAVDLTDGSYRRQSEAGAILERVWAAHPDHPGAPHYLIHAYDYPALAARALPAARRYGAIAPAGMHAQHMPSHIYSMLGLWRDSIASNRAAAELGEHGRHHAPARLDAADPHGMDFIAYAHLQLGEDRAVADALARAEPSEERTLVAARYLLERGDWEGAARMPVPSQSPLDAVTARFVRALGMARANHPVAEARAEVEALRRLREPVLRREGAYWAGLVDVYAQAADAWIARRADDRTAALRLMREAADRDDAREKHILLENKLVPVRELYGELLLDAGRPAEAASAYAASLRTAPNRFRSILGAARSAQALGQSEEARRLYAQAAALTADAAPGRPETAEAQRASRAEAQRLTPPRAAPDRAPAAPPRSPSTPRAR